MIFILSAISAYSESDGGYLSEFVTTLGLFARLQVQCKNKREGKNYAAQEVLAKLHPQAKSWRQLLDLYGPNSKKEKKLESELVAETQDRQAPTVKVNMLSVLKQKMLALAAQQVS